MLTLEDLPLAEYFPVGEFLQDELEARGWSQAEFAEMIGRPAQFVSDVVNSKKDLTTASATQFEAATGIKAATWLGLQIDYKLWSEQQDVALSADNAAIRVRAHVSESLILSLLRKRGVLSSSGSDYSESDQLQKLMEGLDDFALAAKRSDPDESLSREQLTWIVCVRHRGQKLRLPSFDDEKLRSVASAIPELASSLEGFKKLPELLQSAGVGLLYEPAIASGKMDGMTYLQGQNPIIALTGRGRRLDKVLFTLLHEIAHIYLGHLNERGAVIDVACEHESAGREKEANDLARTWALPGLDCPEKITAAWVESIAKQYNLNKAVVVGRMQHEGRLPWNSVLAKGLMDVLPALKSW